MKSYETASVELTNDDIFELRLLRERAEQEARDFRVVRGSCSHTVITDTAREAMHASETINRILRQV